MKKTADAVKEKEEIQKEFTSFKKMSICSISHLKGSMDKNSKKWTLSNQNITDRECIIIAEFIKSNSLLTELRISNNNIGTIGVRAFAEALKTNSTLKILDFRENNIDHVAIEILVESLKDNTSVIE